MNEKERPVGRSSSTPSPRSDRTRSPARSSTAGLEHYEAEELYALVLQCWELRESPYLEDACAAIVAWHRRRPLTALERRQEADAQVTRIRAELKRAGFGRAAA